MQYLKFNINISLSQQFRRGNQIVRIRVTTKSKRIDLYTGITVKKSQWDVRRQKVKQGCVIGNTTYDIINGTLEKYKNFVVEYFNDCARRDEEPNLTERKKRFNHLFKSSYLRQSDEFFYMFDKFINEKSKERGWGKAMKDAYSRLRKIINEFDPNMKFNDLTTEKMNKLTEFLSRSMYNDALAKRLIYFGSFVKWAKAHNYPVNDEFFAFKPKLPKAKKEVRYLEIEELNRISTMKLPKDSSIDRVRDMFVFQCYTALRFSDLNQLRHENIHADSNKNTYTIDLLTEKDDDRINFPLANKAKEIYLKYEDRKYSHGLLFPVISNQKYNEKLKELGKLAKLKGEWIDYEYRLQQKIIIRTPKADLSTHTARRTFIVTAINENVDPTLIALITSHSDLQSMKPYLTKNSKGAAKVIAALNAASGK